MRMLDVFAKALREVVREPLMVVLTVAFAPAFVLLYYFVFPELTPAFTVVVLDQDLGAVSSDGRGLNAGREIEAALEKYRGTSERSLLEVKRVDSREAGLTKVERRECTAMLVIPPGFSRAVAANAAVRRGPPAPPADGVALTGGVTGSSSGREARVSATKPPEFTLLGDLTHPGYLVTATLTAAVVQEYVEEATGRSSPVRLVEEAIGGSGVRSEFEMYIPGVIVFSVIMLVFLAAMVVTRELESGAMRRLRLTRMTAADYLIGTSGMLLIIGILSVILTFATAWVCGFHSEGPLWVVIVALGITTLSVIGVGMMVAAVSRSVAQAFVIANFPLGLLMFFSGTMLPMPRVTWLTIWGHPLGPFEILAPTHAVTALNKVCTLGGGFAEVSFELAALLLLTAAYFAAGVALLRRAQRRVG